MTDDEIMMKKRMPYKKYSIEIDIHEFAKIYQIFKSMLNKIKILTDLSCILT